MASFCLAITVVVINLHYFWYATTTSSFTRLHDHGLIDFSSSSSSSQFWSGFIPVNGGGWIYPSSKLSNSHSPSRSIHGILFLQTNLLIIVIMNDINYIVIYCDFFFIHTVMVDQDHKRYFYFTSVLSTPSTSFNTKYYIFPLTY